MNILIATEFYPESEKEITGGVEARVFNLARQLAKRHFVLVVTSRQPGQANESSSGNIKVIRISPMFPYSATGHIGKRVLFGLNLMFHTPSLIRKYKIDAADFSSFFTYPAAFVSRLAIGNTFITYHEVWIGSWTRNTRSAIGVLGEISETLVLFLMNLFGLQILSVSDFTKSKLIDAGVDEDKIFIVPNGINLNEYETTKAKRAPEKTIVYCGRLVEHKRVSDLIEAAAILNKKERVRIRIIGEGPERKNLEALVQKTGISERVDFLGFIKREELIKHIKEAHVLCHPGTVEGFGITLIESAACGTPFACSNIPVFVEVTKNGKGGLIFRQKEPKDIADKIHRLLSDKRLYDRKISECEELSSHYGWNKIAEKLGTIYEDA